MDKYLKQQASKIGRLMSGFRKEVQDHQIQWRSQHMVTDSSKLTKKNIDALLKFLQIFQKKEWFVPGEWSETSESEEDILSFPAYNYNKKVDEFLKVKENFIPFQST